MFLLHVTTARTDGTTDKIELSMSAQLEFEQIEKVSLIDAVDNKLSQAILLRLSWLATKQTGTIVPASLDEYAKSVKAVGYEVERVPFGEMAITPTSQP